MFTSCIQPVFAPVRCSLTSGSLTGTGREHLLPYIFCTAFWVFRFKATFHASPSKKPCSRWVSLSAASLHVLLFLSTFYILLMIRAASRFVKKFFSSDSSPAPHRQSASPLPCSPPSSLLFSRSTRYPANAVICATNARLLQVRIRLPRSCLPTRPWHIRDSTILSARWRPRACCLFSHSLRMDSETSYEPVPIRTRRQNACRFANTSSI